MIGFRQVLALSLVLGAAFLGSVSAAGAAGSGDRVYLTGPLDKNEMVSYLYKPKSVTLGDTELRLRNLKWSKWSTGEAKGTGTAEKLTCGKSDPGCRKPKVTGTYRASITLNYPRSGDCDHPVWTRSAVSALSGSERGKRAKHFGLGGECFSDGEEG